MQQFSKRTGYCLLYNDSEGEDIKNIKRGKEFTAMLCGIM